MTHLRNFLLLTVIASLCFLCSIEFLNARQNAGSFQTSTFRSHLKIPVQALKGDEGLELIINNIESYLKMNSAALQQAHISGAPVFIHNENSGILHQHRNFRHIGRFDLEGFKNIRPKEIEDFENHDKWGI